MTQGSDQGLGRACQDAGPQTENDHHPGVDLSVRGAVTVCWHQQKVVDSDQEQKPVAHSNETDMSAPVRGDIRVS